MPLSSSSTSTRRSTRTAAPKMQHQPTYGPLGTNAMTGTKGPVSPEDREKILASAKDYIESWLDGDAERMARCLHPALAKRESLEADASAETLTRDQMVQATAGGRGKGLERPYEVSILDTFGDIASVSV